MRVTFVQYGDFREAVARFDRGDDETYASQRYSVDLVCDLARRVEDVCVITVTKDHPEELCNGVRVLGRKLYSTYTEEDLVEIVADQAPTHLITRSPIVPLLRWGVRNQLRVLPMLATSFPNEGLRAWLRYMRIAAALNVPAIPWVGNHNRNSSRALMRIGVSPEKIVPWDWPAQVTPASFPAKTRSTADRQLRLFYAGRIQETKGVGDAIRATALLRGRGLEASLALAGAGFVDEFKQLARSLGVVDHVTFLGLIPHRDVVRQMSLHDVVLVPSQHAYPEGLPLTIYDAYCSRTPLVASDHPMFREQVIDGRTAVVHRGGDANSLADRLAALANDPKLYAQLSSDSADAWERLQLPVKWGDMVLRWLDDQPESRAWLAARAMSSGIYD